MTKSIWVLGVIAAVGGGVFACSGTGSSSGGGPNACLQNAAGSSCYSCVQNNCGASLSTFENACSPFVSCMCSGGSYNGCNAQACASNISSACSSATSGLTSCSACASQCSGFSLDSCNSGSSSGGFSSGSGGFSSSSSGGVGPSCIEQGLRRVSSACASCVLNTCSAQIGTFETACSTFLSCICPGGVFDACNESSCSAGQTSTCTSASTAVGDCEVASCKTQCTASSSSSGGTTCSSGSSSGTVNGSCSGTQTCPSTGSMLQFCTNGSSCYYTVGSQTFTCNSCSDVTSCAQSAAAACQ